MFGQKLRAVFVALADDARRIGATVEHLLEKHFEEGALVLDHENLVEPFCEFYAISGSTG